MRRSIARRLAVPSVFAAATVAVMVVHTLAREHLWRYEWMWATYQYHFGVLLVGPLVCGVGAWVGRSMAGVAWLTRPSGRRLEPVRPVAVAVGTTWLAYLLGWLIPVVLVLRSGTRDGLTIAALATFGPAMVALAAYVVLGVVAGAAVPSRLTPPVVAVGSFTLTMAGWILGLDRIVRLGGAGATMVDLRPAPLVQLAQIVAYGAAAGAGAWWLAGRVGAQPSERRSGVWALAVVAVLTGSWLVSTTTPMFDHPTIADVCVHRDDLSLCAARPYAGPLQPLSRRLFPLVERLRDAGAPVGDRVHLGNMVTLFEPSPPPDIVAGELYPMLGLGSCMDPAASEDIANLGLWLALLAGDRARVDSARLDPTVPEALRTSDAAAQDAWAGPVLARARSTCASAR